jgi:outer membrane lipoprotein SlyB
MIVGAVFWIYRLKRVFLLSSILFFTACAHGPVLYPNAHLKAVGEERARHDIAECERLAKEYVKSKAGLEAPGRSSEGRWGRLPAILAGAPQSERPVEPRPV